MVSFDTRSSMTMTHQCQLTPRPGDSPGEASNIWGQSTRRPGAARGRRSRCCGDICLRAQALLLNFVPNKTPQGSGYDVGHSFSKRACHGQDRALGRRNT